MAMLPKASMPRHAKGQADHVDAWLISYADLITLLFAFFVIVVSITATKHVQTVHAPEPRQEGEPVHPYTQDHFGPLVVKTPYEDGYRMLVGIVAQNREDQNIAVEQTRHGLWIDLAAVPLFARGSADIAPDQLPLLREIAHVLRQKMPQNNAIAVEGYTDDEPPVHGIFANNWELASMRAAHIAGLLAAEGIDPSRLRATGYASAYPLVPNADAGGRPIAENRNLNQRIVIKVERPVDMAAPLPPLP